MVLQNSLSSALRAVIVAAGSKINSTCQWGKFNDVDVMGTSMEPPPAGGKDPHIGRSEFAVNLLRPSVLAFFVLTAGTGFSAETNQASTSGPAARPDAATKQLSAFHLEPGFRIELVASEPMVTAPVAMAFDESGRLFVAEMRGRETRGASVGRVRLLENMNQDGVFQNSTIYADNLTWPSALACYAGGVFVAAVPDLIYLRDTKGDGLADARQVVMSGFGGTNALNSDFLPNNFNWGPDDRIHAASGGIGGDIVVPNVGGRGVSLDGCDFSFDPRTLRLFPESGPAQSGLSFDSQGREFVSDFQRPLLTPMYSLRYALRNPYYPKPRVLAVVADPRAPIFPYPAPPASGRTSRVAGLVLTNQLQDARGFVVYRGRAFPTNYFDNVFIPDPNEHLIHRLVLRDTGLGVVAERPLRETRTEFLTCSDPSFHPVQLLNGPDGALYVADMQDGREHGRIYRILPERLRRPKVPQLGKLKTYELVSVLAQGDGWHSDTAARLLYERNDPAARTLLRDSFERSHLARARGRALQALAGLNALTQDDVLKAMRDPDEAVRTEGVLLSEQFISNGQASAELSAEFGALVNDPSARVRYQLAFTLGQVQQPDRSTALARLLDRDLGEVWMRNAVLSAAATGAGSLFNVLENTPRFYTDAVGFDFLRELALSIGISGQQDATSQAAATIARGTFSAPQGYELLYQLGLGLYRTRSSLALIDAQGVLQPMYSAALNLAADTSQPEAARAAATRLLSVSTYGAGSVADWLLLVCSPPTGPALQSAAVETLSRYNDPQIVDTFLRIWPLLMPAARTQAISALLSRETHVGRVLDALQNRSLAPSELSSAQRNFLRTYGDPTLRARALRLLGPVPVERPQVVTRFKPALSLNGSPAHGVVIFRQRCAGCHSPVYTNQMPSLGPDLLRARDFSREELLRCILEPNRTVRPGYVTQVVESKEGQELLGILITDTPATVTLKQSDGKEVVWPRLNIRDIVPQTWSLMPDGLEAGLSAQDLADLMEYLLRGPG